jgi:hypothetical protein
MEDVFEDLLQRYGVKHDELYGRIEKELSEVYETILSLRTVPTVPSSLETTELGDEPSKL